MSSSATPPYRIETARTVIRCYHPADAPLLKAAIDASLDHLRAWMIWAMDEPSPLEEVVARLRRFRAEFDLDKAYVYGIFNQDESELLGGTGFHLRQGRNAFEIGYWIHARYINQGLATEVTAALTRAGFETCGVDRMEIHCDPLNLRSAAVPRKLGYTHEATLRRRTTTSDGQPRDTMIWSLFAADYPRSPASAASIRAYAVTGEAIRL
jgi:RimJ/RimL family protein N-acetyltransferase